jgi:hypothetical protein
LLLESAIAVHYLWRVVANFRIALHEIHQAIEGADGMSVSALSWMT